MTGKTAVSFGWKMREQQRKKSRRLIIVYIILEIGILAAVLITGQTEAGRFVQYSAIVCNTMVAEFFFIAYGRKREDKQENLVAFALFLTFLADIFLTLFGWGGYVIPGLILFCIVETLYAVYLKSAFPSIIARGILFIVLCVIAKLTGLLTFADALALLNISILIVNVLDSWFSKKKDPGLFFRIGIALFLCCDLCVGISALSGGVLQTVLSLLVWIFYIPSQVLLTLHYVNRLNG